MGAGFSVSGFGSKIFLQISTDSSSLTISEIDEKKNQEDQKLKEVIIEETKPSISESKKIGEEVKEAIAFTEPKAITLEQAYSLFNKGVKFVDARDEPDYLAGHITNSINIPFDDFDNHKQKLEMLSKEKPMVIYCGGTDCDLRYCSVIYYLNKVINRYMFSLVDGSNG